MVRMQKPNNIHAAIVMSRVEEVKQLKTLLSDGEMKGGNQVSCMCSGDGRFGKKGTLIG